MARNIQGAGGGGKGGGSAPTEAPDSLQSRQKVRLVEAISEGEIVGLVDGLKSVYLNDVPVENANGTRNFTGVRFDFRPGTPNQDYIPGFTEQEATYETPNLEVTNSGGAITLPEIPARASSNVDAVRITVGVPGLSIINDEGDISGTSVTLAIYVNNNGGGDVLMKRDTISGKTSSRYQRSYRITLPGDGPWLVKVVRETADSASSKIANKTFVDVYTLISETKMRYSNTAVVGVEMDAEQFANIPVRGYHSRGIKVQVPYNYDPETRAYNTDGFDWNGTFSAKYSNNPAWILYDLITMNRYGLGRYIDPTSIDKWTLYSIAQYCDQLVPDGKGGMEPRYTCNLFIQERNEAFTLISNLASIAHMATFGSGGGLSFVQDRPRDSVALYTAANVIDGKFEYTGASIKAQHNVVLVAWNDPLDKYRVKIEYVDDAESVIKYGIVQKEVVAMGCTSRGQARRLGRAILFAEKFEGEGISFSAGLDSYRMYPGAVFDVSDKNRTLARYGGRLIDSTSTSVTLDAPVTLDIAQTNTIKVMMPDGKVEERTITTYGQEVSTIEVSQAFSQPPVQYGIWIIETTELKAEKWVCVSAEEDAETGNIKIVGMAYRPEKFGHIESGDPLPPQPEYNPYITSPIPTNITTGAYLNPLGGFDILLSWEVAPGTRMTKIAWKREGEGFEDVSTVNNSYTFKNVSVGQYTFVLTTVNRLGLPSPTVVHTFDFNAVEILPDVVNLRLKQPFEDKFASFEWDKYATADSYTVRILDGVTPVREVIVTDNWYVYDYAEATADGGPYRAFTIQVKARYGTLQSGNWTLLAVSNPAPPVPAVTIREITGGFQISAPLPADTDYAGMIVWADTDKNFVVGPGYVVHDGPSNSVNIQNDANGNPLQPGIPVYVYAAFYDVFGKSGLLMTSRYTVTPLSNVADIPVISTLPTFGMTEGQVVYLLSDKKLYRYDGTAWATWVDGSDILAASITSGKISVTSLHTISASLGQISSGNIIIDPTSWIRGGQTDYRTGFGFWQGYHSPSSTYRMSYKGTSGAEFVFDGTDIVLYDALGNAILTAQGGIEYSAIGNPPSSLADINATEASKLASIAAGATRNAYLGEYAGTTQYEYGDIVTDNGSAWFYHGNTPTTGNAPPILPVTSNTWWGAFASQGPAGDQGVNGTRTAILEMYKAAVDQPTTVPQGDCSYTWATGVFTDPTTLNGWSRTPPTPGAGEKLWVVRKVYSDQLTTSPSTVTWPTTNTVREVASGIDGQNGENGWRTAFLELYKWASAEPTTGWPTGDSTYTWADGTFTAPNVNANGWLLEPGAPVPGYTLWATSVRYADQGITTTSPVTWPTTGQVAYAIGAAGTNGSSAKLAVLSASSYVFQVDKNGNPNPASITLTAFGQNVVGAPDFSLHAGGPISLVGTGNTRTLSYVGLSGEYATIKLLWDGQTDYVTIAKVREGSDGLPGDQGVEGKAALTVIVANEAHTMPAATDGTVLNYANSGTTIQVYEGATLLTAGGVSNGSFTINLGAATQSPGSALIIGGGNPVTYNGVTQTALIPDHNAMQVGTDSVVISYPITVKRLDGSTVNFNKTQTITKSKTGVKGDAGTPGTNGVSALTVVMTNEAHSIPSGSDGVVQSSAYAGSGTLINVYEGTTALLAVNSTGVNGSFKIGTITQNPASSITVGARGYNANTVTVSDHSLFVSNVDVVSINYQIIVTRLDGTVATLNKTQTITKSKTGAQGTTGLPGPAGPSVLITSNRAATMTATNGGLDASNQNITFTANVSGLSSPTFLWEFTGFDTLPANSGTNVVTVTPLQFGSAKSATVKCTVNGTYTDMVTIARLELNTADGDADSTSGALESGVTINAGGITIGSGGAIKGGLSSPVDTVNAGWYMGYYQGAYRFAMRSGAGSGERLEVNSDSIKVYDSNNVLRVILGNLSA